ncbi:MAG: BlaI/MecI/CopY family transcriptional regulator [Acidobacteria bacterium]|nr:BlaI/MecI/CopY family transcriptional regulator [Acidobacteriota bacterium]
MDLLYQHGRLSAAEVHARLPDPPSYSAVRALLRVLEQKGHVRHQEEGMRYVFLPKVTREKAKRSALAHLVKTFFGGSPGQAAAALLDASAGELTGEELERLAGLIERARREGR